MISPLNLSQQDRQKLSNAFAWLIQEDKKQNPDLYKKVVYLKHHENK